jgi:hypothetical protein
LIKKERKIKPVRLFLPESLDSELRTYSKVSDVPLAEIIRVALTKFLESDREWQRIRKEKMNFGSGRG